MEGVVSFCRTSMEPFSRKIYDKRRYRDNGLARVRFQRAAEVLGGHETIMRQLSSLAVRRAHQFDEGRGIWSRFKMISVDRAMKLVSSVLTIRRSYSGGP